MAMGARTRTCTARAARARASSMGRLSGKLGQLRPLLAPLVPLLLLVAVVFSTPGKGPSTRLHLKPARASSTALARRPLIEWFVPRRQASGAVVRPHVRLATLQRPWLSKAEGPANPPPELDMSGNISTNYVEEMLKLPEENAELQTECDKLLDDGNMLFERAEYQSAISVYEELLKLLPTCKEALLNMGLAYAEDGYSDDALRCYDKALAVAPAFNPAFYNKGLQLDELGRLEEALEAFRYGLQFSAGGEDESKFWYSMGIVYDQMGKDVDALKAYDKASELTPFDPDVWTNRGQVLSEMGRVEEAIKSFKEALECSEGQDVCAWYNLAIAYGARNNREKAREAVAEGLKVDEDEFKALFQNFKYGAESLKERFDVEKESIESLVENLKDSNERERVDSLRQLNRLWSRLRSIEGESDWMLERICDPGMSTTIRNQMAYGSTFLDEHMTMSEGFVLSEVDKEKKMLVFGSSIGWQCFFGHYALGISKCEGFELMETQVDTAKKVSQEFGISSRQIEFLNQDALESDVSTAGLVWLNTFAWEQEVKESVCKRLLLEAPKDSVVVAYEALPITSLSGVALRLAETYDVETSWSPDIKMHLYRVER